MDLSINNGYEQNSTKVTITDTDLTETEIVRIFGPIRKSMLKNLKVAPTIVTRPRKQDVISFEIIGGSEIERHVVETSTKLLISHLREYSDMHIKIGTYVNRMKDQFGVTDVEDITEETPKVCIAKNHSIKLRQAHYVPHFAIAASQ